MRDRDSFQNSGAILKEMRNKSLEDIATSKHKKNKHKHPVKYADDDIEKYKGELLKSYEKIGALESELKEKNEQLKKLRRSKIERTFQLEADLEVKDEKIKELGLKLKSKNSNIAGFEKEKIKEIKELKEHFKSELDKREHEIKQEKIVIKGKEKAIKEVNVWDLKQKTFPSIEELERMHLELENLLTEKRKQGKDVNIQTIQIRQTIPDLKIAEVFMDTKKIKDIKDKFENIKKELKEL